MTLEQLGHVCVIHLEQRVDRWQQLQKEWKNTFTLHPFLIKEALGKDGCMQSHVQVVAWAKQCNLHHVTVWEDDCAPKNGTPQQLFRRWCALEKQLYQCNDWKIISGGTVTGWLQTGEKKTHPKISETFIQVDSGWLAHWMCYHHSTYDQILDDFAKKRIKTIYDAYLYQTFSPWVPIPFFSTQRKGFSDIDKKQKNIEPRVSYTDNLFYYKSFLQKSRPVIKPCECHVKRLTKTGKPHIEERKHVAVD